MKSISLRIVFLFCFLNAAYAQQMDSVVNHAAASFLQNGPRVGLSIGVIDKGKVYEYHFGTIQKGTEKLPKNETIYEIGSLTKTFTSMLLAQALVDKKVNLDDDIRKYLKESYPNLEYQGKPIRLRHLANLTSGLPDNLPEKMAPFTSQDRESQLLEFKKIHDSYTQTEFLKDLHQVKLLREPGLNPAHSNTAAQLLGILLENIYGKSYQELLSVYLTKPLSMENTFTVVPPTLTKNLAKSYDDKGTQMPEIPIDAASAGVLKSTLGDMTKYLAHQLAEKDGRVKLAHTLQWGNPDGYGIGLNWWLKKTFDNKREIWASGGTFGFSSYLILYPESNFGVVMLSNENDQGAEDALSNAAHNIYNQLHFSPDQMKAEGFGFSKSVHALLIALNENGFRNAVNSVNDLKKKNPGYQISEDELNNLGYSFLNRGNRDKALEIFKLNVSLFPESGNTYDSLAETYEGLGEKELAIKYYKRALELNPQNGNAKDHLQRLGN